MERDIGVVNAQIMASVLNSAQIQILNYFYSHILRHLTDKENHRYVHKEGESHLLLVLVLGFVLVLELLLRWRMRVGGLVYLLFAAATRMWFHRKSALPHQRIVS